MYENARVVIFEEPSSDVLRFRYSSEGRQGGSLQGVNSTITHKTVPAIQVLNYTGLAYVVVSCVNQKEPYEQHPHNLIGKGCQDGNGKDLGVCYLNFSTNSESPSVIQFSKLGIQCTKKIEITDRLKHRKKLRIDPFRAGFKCDSKMDFNCVRLCFQVVLKPNPMDDKFQVPLTPIVSQPITDKRFVTDLTIHDISDTTSPASGGKKILLFVNNVTKEDIRVRFFEKDSNQAVVWEDWADSKTCHVFRKVGISFLTPKFRWQDIGEPVNVFIQLQRIHDKQGSDPMPFQYIRNYTNIDYTIKRKKCKIDESKKFCDHINLYEEQRQGIKVNSNFSADGGYTQNIPTKIYSENIPTGTENVNPMSNYLTYPYVNDNTLSYDNGQDNNTHGTFLPNHQNGYNIPQLQYPQENQLQQCYQQSPYSSLQDHSMTTINNMNLMRAIAGSSKPQHSYHRNF